MEYKLAVKGKGSNGKITVCCRLQSLQGWWCFVLGDAQEQGDNDRGRRNITHFFGCPEAPVQESKQLLPQLHKPLHLSVNVSDFVILIVPYSAPGNNNNKKKVICLENKQGYTYFPLSLSILLFFLYFILWSDVLLQWHLLFHMPSSLQRSHSSRAISIIFTSAL